MPRSATTTFTDLGIRAIAAKGSDRVEIWDAKTPGFGMRVSPTGTKTFVLLYYHNGRKRRLTLGRFPVVTLSQARSRAIVALGQVAGGFDPQASVAERASASTDSFQNVVADFVRRHCGQHNRASTAYETERVLRSRFCSAWGDRKIGDITRADVIAVLDAAVRARAPSAANHALSAVRKLFNWCLERGVVESNPCLGISRPAATRSRDRVLTDPELVAIWQAAEVAGYPFGTIVKLLMLTGQRRGEVAGMRWVEIDTEQALWTIPAERTKNKKAHTIPLAPRALSIINSVPRISDVLLFPARGSTAQVVSGFSKMKPKLAATIEVQNWTLHDLRRTLATGLAGRGVPPHVIERVLNHVTGTFGGVAGIYNRFEYLPEMRRALERWSEHIGHCTQESGARHESVAQSRSPVGKR